MNTYLAGLAREGLLVPGAVENGAEKAFSESPRPHAALVVHQYAEEVRLLEHLSRQFDLPIISLKKISIDPAVIKLLPEEFVKKAECLPLEILPGGKLALALFDPADQGTQEEAAFLAGRPVKAKLCQRSELLEAIEHFYDVTMESMLEGMNEESAGDNSEEYHIHDLEEQASEPTLINLVNLIISKAIEDGVSDIHIEPYEKEMKVKYRVDGILQEIPPPPRRLQPAIVSRIKIMAGLDIAKRHIPQDGFIRINVQKQQVDIRVATVPTIFGEGVVMRLLNKSAILLSIEQLGFSPSLLHRFEPMLTKSYGMNLVTGPTGSGKTTTLYAVLNRIFTPEKKIITIEDPVEYQLTGVNQIPVRPQRGVTFASGLRSVLRLDPDILLVGEIRDVDTAEIAIRSALTGHLIFSTLHTNDSASAITRLMDMGVEPFLIASSLLSVLAQRLVRKVCPHCATPYDPPAQLLSQLDKTPADCEGAKFVHANACEHCAQRGYQGRLGLFELLTINDELRQMIVNREASVAIKNAALKEMKTMREDGWEKLVAGVTTFEEVLRVTQRDYAENGIDVEILDE